MKNLDNFSRWFLSLTLGLSAFLLSGSLFLFALKTISPASAGVTRLPENLNEFKTIQSIPLQDDMQDDDIRAVQAFGIGIRDGNLYFGILYSNNTIGLHRSVADGEDVLDW